MWESTAAIDNDNRVSLFELFTGALSLGSAPSRPTPVVRDPSSTHFGERVSRATTRPEGEGGG